MSRGAGGKAAALEQDRFDELTARLVSSLTRRRSVGVLGILGLSGVAALDAVDARRKKKRKKKKTSTTTTTTLSPECAACSACETCINNTCVPRAEGDACGNGGRCAAGTCAQVCEEGQVACPIGLCRSAASGQFDLCVQGGDICARLACDSQDDCQLGEQCVSVNIIITCSQGKRCATIIQA